MKHDDNKVLLDTETQQHTGHASASSAGAHAARIAVSNPAIAGSATSDASASEAVASRTAAFQTDASPTPAFQTDASPTPASQTDASRTAASDTEVSGSLSRGDLAERFVMQFAQRYLEGPLEADRSDWERRPQPVAPPVECALRKPGWFSRG